jgi:hypothetical protein
MPKVSKQSAAHVEVHGIVDDRREVVDGYTMKNAQRMMQGA